MTSLVNTKSIASTCITEQGWDKVQQIHFVDQDLPFPGLFSFGVICTIRTTYIHRCVPTALS